MADARSASHVFHPEWSGGCLEAVRRHPRV